MKKNEDVWYRLGYALETARHRGPAPTKVAKLTRLGKKRPVDEVSHKVLDAVLAVGAGSVLTRALSLWPGRRRPGLFRLFRAGAAGAAAGFLAELIRPVLVGDQTRAALEEELTDILLSGAGRGLLYAAVVEPRVPGPSALQGAIYAALEYALYPWGGLEALAGSQAPHKKVPVLSALFKGQREEELFLQHLAFGLALALLYDR
jgi:hypothetical protein